ncbi:flavodoxin family protein [Thalassobacillus pellis]|uniref:flavodoxin family protein n=1 Tax=Thalassobacillus pellis TaxID=748008 RepID=UPI0019611D8E|nr:NAD(P)H-dependent oxidoreductase [Thalassobacillus pellis]MBM7551189.1 multimeric flavodoxin WrbA [Thalassobacillus pellis]
MKAVLLNTSLKPGTDTSDTEELLHETAQLLQAEHIDTNRIHLRDFHISFGITSRLDGDDDWPFIFDKIKEADIVIIGTPIAMGEKSSIASLILERLQGYHDMTNPKGQTLFYNKVAGVIVAGGNEDGARLAAQSIFYRLSMLGFTIPPHAHAAFENWEEENEEMEKDEVTSFQNIERMTYNLIHFAELFHFHPIPTLGNTIKP